MTLSTIIIIPTIERQAFRADVDMDKSRDKEASICAERAEAVLRRRRTKSQAKSNVKRRGLILADLERPHKAPQFSRTPPTLEPASFTSCIVASPLCADVEKIVIAC
jgi:hypothetical protein